MGCNPPFRNPPFQPFTMEGNARKAHFFKSLMIYKLNYFFFKMLQRTMCACCYDYKNSDNSIDNNP